MREVLKGLFQTELERPYGGAVTTCAYFVQRAAGNILLYGATNLECEFELIRAHGGLRRHYIGHEHEVGPELGNIARTFDSELVCHDCVESEARQWVAKVRSISTRTLLDDGVEGVPAPGHSPGSLCFLLSLEGKRILFTGDTLYLNDGQWSVAVEPGMQVTLIASLRLLAEMEPDILCPGLSVGVVEVTPVLPEQFAQIIKACIGRLEHGAVH